MTNLCTHRPKAGRCLTTNLLAIILVSLGPAICVAQSVPNQIPQMQWSNDLTQYPGLMPEFIHLLDKLQHEVQLPPARAQSHILPLLPESTVFYAAFPNYGDASRQALQIFHQELQESPVLRDWWQHVNAEGTGKVEDRLQTFYELSQYLGDEIVIAGSAKGMEPSILFVAEVRKPELKAFLEQLVRQFPATPRPALRVLDLQDLAVAKDAPGQQPIIFVGPDFAIGASSVAALRSFNASLSQHNPATLSSTSFGQRLTEAYAGGLSMVGAADLHSMLKLVLQENKDKELTLERTGFSDVKYLVWEHKTIGGHDISQAELSFNGPRRGIASWLAAPRQLGSLDFVSPKSVFAVSVGLTSPAQIFDDIQELASASASGSNPNPLVMAAPMAQMLGINLKDDLLNLLTGEIAIELDSTTPSAPVWRVMLGVKDLSHLQRTISTLLAASHIQEERSEQGGLTYYSLATPSATKPLEIGYTFVDGYLVVGSSREAVTEAVRLHRQGGSLAKSEGFLASLPPDHAGGISALLYEDPSAMAMSLAQAAPEVRESLSPMLQGKMPLIVCAYGDEDAIREATTSAAFDPTAALVLWAVAIPNLLRAKIAANDSSAVSTLRTVNTAQLTYSAAYPQRGFAPTLATLGTDPATPRTVNANHAGLIEESIGNPSCTASAWCVKDGYRFQVTGECRQRICKEFVAVATPVSTSTGGRNFCSTSEGVIRFRLGGPRTTPITALECKGWQPLQ